MLLGKVIGTVVCTRKVESFEGIKLLLVQEGDVVFYEGGREAALGLANWFNPSDATIMGIVDRVDVEGAP
jgi:ethanolamine utilization protein EutN